VRSRGMSVMVQFAGVESIRVRAISVGERVDVRALEHASRLAL
jgi:hypothetical protein